MAGRALAALVLAAAVALAGCGDSSSPAEEGVVIDTTAGAVRGAALDGIESWKGIPYAAPPTGERRWRPPQPPEPWSTTRDADDYGPSCLQGTPTALSESLREVGGSDEDCLTLNVHRPEGQTGPLPVMVWIHGGAFVYGAGSQVAYNSPELVRRGVVLVTVNYRLGRLGFLAHPALQDGDSRVANFGLLDQVAALSWVQDNIAAFGGDPDNVTIFGASAGGVSVNALMVSPEARGLFDRGISQSGLGREPSLGWQAAVADARSVLEPLAGPDPSADQLRDLAAQDVMELPTNLLTGQAPVLDDVLPESVSAAFDAGREAAVPYLTGTTDLELPESILRGTGRDPEELREELIGDRAAEALTAYGTEAEIALHLVSDSMFTEPARHLSLAHADRAPTYRYLFTLAPQTVLDRFGGAPHTSEIPFVFDDTRRQGVDVPDADALADAIADLWVDFAAGRAPDGWPEAQTGQLVRFTKDGPVAGPDPWQARLDLLEDGVEQAARRGEVVS